MSGKKQDSGSSFSGKLGFVLAAAGSAVGLGNMWGFPYKLGANGGFGFLLLYLVLLWDRVLVQQSLIQVPFLLAQQFLRTRLSQFLTLMLQLLVQAWFLFLMLPKQKQLR